MAGVHQLPNNNKENAMTLTLRVCASAPAHEPSSPLPSTSKRVGVSSDSWQRDAINLQTVGLEPRVLSEKEVSGWLAFRPPHIEHLALDTATQGTRVAVPYKRVPLMSNQIIRCMNTLFAIGV